MKKILSAVAVTVISVVLSGCASPLMRDASTQQISPSNPGRVKVVFMRSSMVAGAIGCDVFEVINGELRFVGQLPTGNKIVYETTPGEKVFMTYGAAADFMPANLAGGKTYYSIVRPNWGTGGFAPTPIRGSSSIGPDLKSKDFKDWLSGTKLIEPNENAPAWFAENKERLQKIYTEYWSRFERKNSQEKAERTMMPQDGQ
ncbi:MAG: hypothetical protein E6H51_03510 [Betaproteobacteria bacterium]|nr:MAG: hypothetical protein E6H51_03510 [Betaproteobacteria bacterium]